MKIEINKVQSRELKQALTKRVRELEAITREPYSSKKVAEKAKAKFLLNQINQLIEKL